LIRNAAVATLDVVRQIREDNLQPQTIANATIQIIKAADEVPDLVQVRSIDG
jgi:hypothetical protein